MSGWLGHLQDSLLLPAERRDIPIAVGARGCDGEGEEVAFVPGSAPSGGFVSRSQGADPSAVAPPPWLVDQLPVSAGARRGGGGGGRGGLPIAPRRGGFGAPRPPSGA